MAPIVAIQHKVSHSPSYLTRDVLRAPVYGNPMESRLKWLSLAAYSILSWRIPCGSTSCFKGRVLCNQMSITLCRYSQTGLRHPHYNTRQPPLSKNYTRRWLKGWESLDSLCQTEVDLWVYKIHSAIDRIFGYNRWDGLSTAEYHLGSIECSYGTPAKLSSFCQRKVTLPAETVHRLVCNLCVMLSMMYVSDE